MEGATRPVRTFPTNKVGYLLFEVRKKDYFVVCFREELFLKSAYKCLYIDYVLINRDFFSAAPFVQVH